MSKAYRSSLFIRTNSKLILAKAINYSSDTLMTQKCSIVYRLINSALPQLS